MLDDRQHFSNFGSLKSTETYFREWLRAELQLRNVSVLFNEPKLLKLCSSPRCGCGLRSFSALQRAEIAEIRTVVLKIDDRSRCFSALQRAEIAEIRTVVLKIDDRSRCFSALQRAEIAEIKIRECILKTILLVSVLFNEPKLLKFAGSDAERKHLVCFSALQRAEIAEIDTQAIDR